MTKKEFNEVKEYIHDHFRNFNAYPGEVETAAGLVYSFEDYVKYL